MPTAPNQTLLKAAAGDAQSFETALAGIGRATINSRCPTIAKYEIGFQVLDQDDDNTRAVGVFGYKIGGRLYYVPMFYRDGVTKGVEQLRDPKRRRAVPLTDNWVNKLTADKGDDEPKLIDRSRLTDTARPSLWQLKTPPTKWAADDATKAADAAAARRDLAPALVHGGPLAGTWGHTEDLFKVAAEHPDLLAGVDEAARRYPWFAAALGRYHTAEKVAAALDRAATVKAARSRVYRPRYEWAKAASPKIVTVRVSRITLSRVPFEATDYTPQELSDLSSGNNVYKDSRGDDEVSVLETLWGNRSGGGTGLSNPLGVGVQPVLGDDMRLHQCAVLFPLVGWEETPGACLVVRVSDGANCVVDRNSVWVSSEDGVDLDAGVKWHAGLTEPGAQPPRGRVAAVYMSSGKHLHATVPFTSDENGYVNESGVYTSRPYWAAVGTTRPADPMRRNDDNRKYRVVDGAGRMVTAGSTLYLPGGGRTRFVDLEYGTKRFRPANGDDPDRFLAPGLKAAADAAGLATLHVKRAASGTYGFEHPHTGAWVDSGTGPDLEADLVERLRFRPKAARAIVAACAERGEARAAFRPPTKAAAMVDQNFPNAPSAEPADLRAPNGFADDVVPSQTAQSLAVPVPDAGELPGAREVYAPYPVDTGVQVPVPGIGNSGDRSRDPSGDGALTADDARRVSAAAQSGVKELFDTAALASLVKRKRIDPVVDKVVRSGASVMNDLADALCHMYWNSSEWADRFGQTEIGALEDQFRDHFEGIGDLSLSLQEKAVDGDRDFGLLPELANVDASRAGGA